MGQASNRKNEAADQSLRHRRVPSRILGNKLVVARPLDGAPVVLASTATVVWQALDGWTTVGAIDLRLDETFPTIAKSERDDARVQILAALQNDDLLEYS